MASIVFNNGEKAILDACLNGAGSSVGYDFGGGGPQMVPAPSDPWGVGLGTSSVSELNKASDVTAIDEIGTTSAGGYERQSLLRHGTGWPPASLTSGSFQSAATQVTFTFSGAPSPNGANMWFLAGSDVVGHDNALFGADLAQERTYSNGNQHQIDCELRLS